MSFWDLFKRKKKKIEVTEESVTLVELKDPVAIKNYVIGLCEQMTDISHEMEDVRREYEQVTAYLNDIQIVENLGGEQKEQLIDVCTSVSKLTNARNAYLNAEHRISDETFNQMQELEAEIPDIIKRLKSNETYLDAIKRDLNRLAGEKVEWSVLRHEAEEEQKHLRRLSYVLLYLFGGITVVVAMLSLMMKWDFLPISIVALIATMAGSYIVIRMQECGKQIRKCDVNQNRAIILENRVKIKYINIKNAVDYVCQRFHVTNSMQLTYNYEQYIEACKEREKFKQNNEDLEYFKGRLVRIMQSLNLYDSRVWVNYADAVIDKREMVEVKHDLFARRQSLRSRIENNLVAIEDIKKEIQKYSQKMGDKMSQINSIIQKVDNINRAYRQ